MTGVVKTVRGVRRTQKRELTVGMKGLRSVGRPKRVRRTRKREERMAARINRQESEVLMLENSGPRTRGQCPSRRGKELGAPRVRVS